MCQAGSVVRMKPSPAFPVRPTSESTLYAREAPPSSWVAVYELAFSCGRDQLDRAVDELASASARIILCPSAAADSGERAKSLGIHVFAIVAQLRGRFMSDFDRAHWIRSC